MTFKETITAIWGDSAQKEFAAIAGVNVRTVRNWIAHGEPDRAWLAVRSGLDMRVKKLQEIKKELKR